MNLPPTDEENTIIAAIDTAIDHHFAALDTIGAQLYQSEGLSQEAFLSLYEHASGGDRQYRQHIGDLNAEDDAWDTAARKAAADA